MELVKSSQVKLPLIKKQVLDADSYKWK